MRTVSAYAAPSATAPLAPAAVRRRDPRPDDVVIEIKYCGICHSDIHTVRDEWGEQRYPLVPGHEITGVVAEVGAGVTRFGIGDRVGVGCLVDSCGRCASCRAGFEQYCENGCTYTYGSAEADGEVTQGGYSTHIVVPDRFVLKIPAGLELDVAAPLLCAGITTYSPLRYWDAGPGKKVAIVGLGGLGHMAVKLAHALGAEVTVLSQSLKKMDDGIRLGADHYHATSDPDTFSALATSFDLVLNTVSAVVDLDAYLGLLARDGTLACVGAPGDPLALNVFSLLTHRRKIAGSMIGGIAETQEMLDFCGEHGIGADVEVVEARRINDAYERVLGSDVRYRFVIDIGTLPELQG